MRYSEGRFGRVFLVKFEDRDDLLAGLKQVAMREKIRVATVTLLGGMRSGGLVSGPKEPVIPPEPIWTGFEDGREVIGFGTLFREGEEPVIHLHGGIGRDQQTLVGCVRRDTSVYLTVEAVIAEISGIDACKVTDEKTGVAMLELPTEQAK